MLAIGRAIWSQFGLALLIFATQVDVGRGIATIAIGHAILVLAPPPGTGRSASGKLITVKSENQHRKCPGSYFLPPRLAGTKLHDKSEVVLDRF